MLEINEINCPNCNHRLNCANNYINEVKAPVKGEKMVCAYCRSILVFQGDLSVNMLSESDIDNFDEGDLLRMQNTMEAIDDFHEQNNETIELNYDEDYQMQLTRESPKTMSDLFTVMIGSKMPFEVLDCVLYEYGKSHNVVKALRFAVNKLDL